MPEIHTRSAFFTKASKDDDTYTFLASSEKADSYGDIVVQEGISLKRFKKNPIILYQHRQSEPIGTGKAYMGEKGLMVDIKLAPPGISSVVDTVRGLIEAGILKAVSIGFSALEYEPIRNKDNEFTGYKFLKSLLHEISVVSIGANDEALAIAKSYNLSTSQCDELFQRDTSQDDQKRMNKNRLTLLKLKEGN